MWPFSRKSEPTSTPETGPVTPKIHFDWKGLPSIQRTIADHPLTVPTESFSSDLATHDDPRALAKPLGHQVSLEAPPGIVLGITRTQTRSDGPDLIPGPRPGRRPAAVQRFIDESAVTEPEEAEVEPTETRDVAAPVMPVRRLAASTEPVPSVQLMRVTPDAEPTPLEPEVAMPSEEPPGPLVEATQPAESTTEIPAYPRLTLGQARRLGLGAPIKHVPDTATSVQRITEVSTHSSEPTTHPMSGIHEESAPKFEPFVLDYLVNKKQEIRAPAPISRPQRIPVSVSRSTTDQPSEIAPPDEAPESMGLAESGQESTSGPTATPADPTTTPADLTATPPAMPAVVQRTAEHEQGDDVPVQLTSSSVDDFATGPIAGPPPIAAATDPRRTLLGDAPEGEAGEGEGEATSPLPLAFGTSPKESEVRVSDSEISSSSIVSPGASERSPRLSTNPMAPLISDRPQLIASASPPITASVQRGTEPTALPIQRALDAAAAQGRVTSDAGVRRELARSVASTPGVALPSRAESSPSFAGSDVAIASASPVTRPSFPTSLPLARPAPQVFAAASSLQRSAATQASTESERWSPVQTSTAVLEPQTGEPSMSMQRAPAHEWTVSAQADPGATGPSLAAGEASSSTPDANNEGQMEDLAAKLYDRIRIRLRNELLVDRERAGFLTDLR